MRVLALTALTLIWCVGMAYNIIEDRALHQQIVVAQAACHAAFQHDDSLTAFIIATTKGLGK